MREIFDGYGGMILATVGSFLILGVLGYHFFSEGSLMAQMVSLWGNGGC